MRIEYILSLKNSKIKLSSHTFEVETINLNVLQALCSEIMLNVKYTNVTAVIY